MRFVILILLIALVGCRADQDASEYSVTKIPISENGSGLYNTPVYTPPVDDPFDNNHISPSTIDSTDDLCSRATDDQKVLNKRLRPQ